ncbi:MULTISPECIES: glutathione S-transferase family protein [Sphingobium]|uniref:Glutathione S-transferase n=2 Tax=Sphingobium TaxID=165695 RepID=A0A8E1C136_9SPHN|nr:MULTISPECIES: glutathione S-transferase N-terminal domain-containing protein [Sphingobium]EPR12545.1 glutathione S-transferase [Sphingobium indicum IP26]AMK20753.1 glutathione S-transferase [Sphingobium sp. MI1205]AMK21406.1 glutathione S-transferase [Sphingobium sp. TKS]EQB03539.1 glutathione S-transferase [Sphingobium sp. HDIP04]EQB15489.1 glutathione S-transferase [Sphingobium lactosutens DS20]
MIKLHTWTTPNGRKVSIALEELGLEYEVVPVDLSKDEQLSPAFLQLNPNNKIPVIEDSQGPGGRPLVLFESGAILIYLAEKTGKLLPASAQDRYLALQWLMFQMGGVGPMFGQTHHFRRFASGEAYPLKRFSNETHRLYRVLEGQLRTHRYLAGSEYGIADIAIYPWVDRFELHDISWDSLPSVKRWFDEVGARPAVQRGMSIPHTRRPA